MSEGNRDVSTEMQSSDVYKPVGRRLLVEAAKTIEELQVCGGDCGAGCCRVGVVSQATPD